MALINIIIPIYNQAQKLDACLKSIFNQTFQDFSVIIVDDGSTDNLDEVLQPYLNEGDIGQCRLRVVRQKHAGSNTARNNGAKQATAEFIIFCDADIVMKPTMLEKMYRALQANPKAAYVYSPFRFGFKIFRLWPFSPEKLKQMPYIHTTSLIRRQDFPGFSLFGGCSFGWDEKIQRLQDWDLWLTMLRQGKTGIWIPEVLFSVKGGGTKSRWLPSFAYKLFPNHPQVIAYNQAVKIIKEKHKI